MSKIIFKTYKAIDFCDDVRDGTHDSPKHLDFGKILITSKNIKDNYIDFTNVSYISKIYVIIFNIHRFYKCVIHF